MHVETHAMDPRIARIHYLDYRARIKKNREARKEQLVKQASDAGKELGRIRIERTKLEREDAELMKAYRAMSLGQRIINIQSVIMKAGVDKKHLPKLAIAGAGWEHCYFESQQWGSTVFRKTLQDWSSKKANKIQFPREVFPAETWNKTWRASNNLPNYPVKALVPSIPMQLRPEGDLNDYHILWEAEWSTCAPVDPLLLKHVEGNTYTVLAQWDLTPLERSILEGRLT